MSEASGYSLHLYCDQENPAHGFTQFPHQYTGETRAECVKQARKEGWVFHRDGKHSCPQCTKGRPPKEDEFNPFSFAAAPEGK